MQLKNLIPLFAVAVLLFSSCQREASFEELNNNNNNAGDSIYLKAVAELDTTLPSGSDTMYKVSYTYDAAKRVTTYSFDDRQWGGQLTEMTKYFYNVNETEPYKMIEYFSDAASDYVDTTFLTYSGGIVTKDSSILYNMTSNVFWGIEIKTFAPGGNNTLMQSRGYFTLPATTPDYQWSGTIMQSRNNGNIIQQDDTSTFNIMYTNHFHHQVSYDDKPNPVYKTQVHYPILNGYLDAQKNNVLEVKEWDIPGQIKTHYRYEYVYRNDGYPVIARITDVQPPSTTTKVVFIYTD